MDLVCDNLRSLSNPCRKTSNQKMKKKKVLYATIRRQKTVSIPNTQYVFSTSQTLSKFHFMFHFSNFFSKIKKINDKKPRVRRFSAKDGAYLEHSRDAPHHRHLLVDLGFVCFSLYFRFCVCIAPPCPPSACSPMFCLFSSLFQVLWRGGEETGGKARRCLFPSLS